MAGQRTFTLIPQFPGRNDSPENVRPMTSKQVQKAYKAANKGPRMSRIERIKQEKAEQERIRKEFEKEKAAAKARAAREKKKGKELAEKEEKRKRGLPLVTVRPSQDTISWFVRGNGSSKKRDAQGQQLKAMHGTIPNISIDQPETPNLEDITEEEEIEEHDTKESDNGTEETSVPQQKPTLDNNSEVQKDEHAREQVHMALDDLDNIDDEDFSSPNTPDLAKQLALETKEIADWVNLDDLDDLDDDFEDDLALEILEDVEASAKKIMAKKLEHGDQQPKATFPAQPTVSTPIFPKEVNRLTRYEQDLGLKIQTLMAPPPTLKSPSPSPPHQAPPLSTQAIFSNIDAFFPSPSQQARELEDDFLEDKFPEPSPLIPPEKKPQKEPDPPEPSLPKPRADSPSPPPRRFFTSSGSHELMSLALQRSRRSAELEKIQQRDRMRIQPETIVRDQAVAARAQPKTLLKLQPKLPARMQVQQNQSLRKPQQPLAHTVRRLDHKVDTRMVGTRPAGHIGVNSQTKMATNLTTAKKLDRPMPEVGRGKAGLGPSLPPAKQPHTLDSNKENTKPRDEQQHPNQAPPPSASQESEYGGGAWIDEIALELMI